MGAAFPATFVIVVSMLICLICTFVIMFGKKIKEDNKQKIEIDFGKIKLKTKTYILVAVLIIFSVLTGYSLKEYRETRNFIIKDIVERDYYKKTECLTKEKVEKDYINKEKIPFVLSGSISYKEEENKNVMIDSVYINVIVEKKDCIDTIKLVALDGQYNIPMDIDLNAKYFFTFSKNGYKGRNFNYSFNRISNTVVLIKNQ